MCAKISFVACVNRGTLEYAGAANGSVAETSASPWAQIIAVTGI
jgi:hypothetical protein